MLELLNKIIPNIVWQDILEIVILAFVIYKILISFKGTRGAQVLKGIGIMFLLVFVADLAKLYIISLTIKSILGLGAIGLIIVFQPELRQGLARMGQNPLFGLLPREEQKIKEISKAVGYLSTNKTGALIVLSRGARLHNFIETGVKMDSELSSPLLETIFTTKSPTHDGAVIIVNNRIAAVSCTLPLAEEVRERERTKGMRHRAAIGLTQETDAVVIVVSEESGAISIVKGGVAEEVEVSAINEKLAV